MQTNRICDLLGIRYPIIQAPMNWVSGVSLAAAVSNAGGLGTLGPNAGEKERTRDPLVSAEGVRRRIREMKRLTENPFALNIPVGFTEKERLHSEKTVQVALEEGLPVAIVSVGSPNVYTDVLKKGGTKVFHAVSTKEHALKAESMGVDAVICEGFEAGGHKGFTELTTFVLVPMVADAVKVPVVAGGGIGDVRGLLAALMLGADAAYMGTRFMMAAESSAHAHVKETLLGGDDVCTVSLKKRKMLARDFRNRFSEVYSHMLANGASVDELETFLADHSQYHSQFLGHADMAEICCGQVAGLVNEIEGAGDIIHKLVEAVGFHIEILKEKARPFGL
ncbi:MAG: nitronate monooxygenase [Deltaproteobacteria bacterium]|nr:nitronate monooxygenase [Deltaproteobacteria bacterium]